MKSPVAFGPIPSRRLGMSLGINHIPPKTCSYDCVYCQVRKRATHLCERTSFFSVDEVVRVVGERLEKVRKQDGKVDYLTFVPDGEPTLDKNLGSMIKAVQQFDLPVAVVSNSTMIDDQEVQSELALADWVSLKLDTVDEKIWKELNRPAARCSLFSILDGMMAFSRNYNRTLVTETMLVKGINDSPGFIQNTAEFIAKLGVMAAYVLVPTRPPIENWVELPGEKRLLEAYDIFKKAGIPNVEVLSRYSELPFEVHDDLLREILDITQVHPLRSNELSELLTKANKDMDVIEPALEKGVLKKLHHRDDTFYVRTHVEDTIA